MIVPMKHATILCLARDREKTLAALAELGLVHVEEAVSDSPDVAAAAAAGEAAECARDAIAEARANPDDLGLALRRPPSGPRPAGLVSDALAAVADYVEARSEREELDRVAARFEPWGDFDPAAARALADNGVPFALFSASAPLDPAVFPPSGVLRIVRRGKDRVFGAFVGAPLPAGVEEAPLPAERLSATLERRAAAETRMRKAAAALRALAPRAGEAAAAIRAAADAKALALASANLLETGPVAHLTGWMPADGAAALSAAARREGWGFALRDPAEGETPPVQLRPPRAFRPILVVFRALGILPGYAETDVSVPFFCFFTLFFAMLVGDAGYGALLLLAGAWALRSARRKGPLSPFARSCFVLVGVFGAATVLWGFLTATWFGIPHDAAHDWLPHWLVPKTAAWLGDQAVIMHICFSIGLAHLLLGRFWNVVQLCPDSRALAQLGWAGVSAAMYCIVCSIAIDYFEYPGWASWLLGLSVVLILLFTYKPAELKENAVSLVMTPLNVISAMGDIISYVRLFAVSLAAVKIAETFNTMAGDMDLPLWAKLPVMLVILLLGHSLNLAMSALSILVHAVRLNTLEFSGAKGISWSGAEYAPFRRPEAAVKP